ncbi:unnamed protein product [Linum trigynum]|uniref:CCHC-type domain-containing protein n=1 Tax=Linum trigynum TaxID=586398 RepID=A0AAV2DEK5_9ROSI
MATEPSSLSSSSTSGDSTLLPVSSISLSANPQLTVKLTPTNYLLWHAQITPLLRCHQLMGHVDGSLPALPQIVNGQSNSAYWSWYVRDQYVLTWINLSLSEAVLPNVVNKATALDAWSVLATIYALGSPVIIDHLRKSLLRLSRGNETIHEYIHRAKAIYDKMLALGATVTEQELVVALLDDLDEDYCPFTRNLEARLEPISFENVSSLLLSEEVQLHRCRSSSGEVGSPHSFYSSRGGRSAGATYATEPSGMQVEGFPTRAALLTMFLQVAGPIQVAQGLSHPRCWVLGPTGLSLMMCHNCGGKGHVRAHCPSPIIPAQSNYHPGPSSYLAQSSHLAQSSQQWLLDSDANHHLTADLGNLIHHSEYNGPNQVTFGNGSPHEG